MLLNIDDMLHRFSDVELTVLLLEFSGFNLAQVEKILNYIEHHIALRVLNFDPLAYLLDDFSDCIFKSKNGLVLI